MFQHVNQPADAAAASPLCSPSKQKQERHHCQRRALSPHLSSNQYYCFVLLLLLVFFFFPARLLFLERKKKKKKEKKGWAERESERASEPGSCCRYRESEDEPSQGPRGRPVCEIQGALRSFARYLAERKAAAELTDATKKNYKNYKVATVEDY